MRNEGCQCTEGPAQRHSFLLPKCRGQLRIPDAPRAFSERMHLWLGPILWSALLQALYRRLVLRPGHDADGGRGSARK